MSRGARLLLVGLGSLALAGSVVSVLAVNMEHDARTVVDPPASLDRTSVPAPGRGRTDPDEVGEQRMPVPLPPPSSDDPNPAAAQPVPQPGSTGAAPSSTTTVASATVPTPRVDGADRPGRWIPEPGTEWQWQLSGRIDLSIDVPIYDLDGFDTSAEQVAALHSRGRRVICYLNVGAWEAWRPDAGAFPASALGHTNGWPGERWLDVRALDLLEPLLAARFDMCVEKGFDAIEPDNIDGFLNDSGFPLTARDQLVFNRRLAEMAHERGLSIGLKNDVEQVGELVDWFDFAINEECARYGECHLLIPFVRAGKAVLHVEYDLDVPDFCHVTTPLGFSSMVKDRELTAWRIPC